MLMKTTKRSKPSRGFTFTEVMGAIAVLTVAILGTSAYRYHATVDVRKADLKTSGARIGCLLCETWRGVPDPNAFNPASHLGADLTILTLTSYEGPGAPTGHTSLGTYGITVNEEEYRATLFHRAVSPGLRALSVIVVWDWDRQKQSFNTLPPSKSFRLTTYITE
jgi:hypothetical protein